MGFATLANTEIFALDGKASVDFKDASVFANDINTHSKIIVFDSLKNKLEGYLKEMGSGKTYGAEKLLNPGYESFNELTANPDFSSDTWWTRQAGWTISDGVANAVNTSGAIFHAQNITKGIVYRVTYTITVTAGSVKYAVGAVGGPERTASGTYTEDIIAGATGSLNCGLLGTVFTGTVDNVSMLEPLSNWTLTPNDGTVGRTTAAGEFAGGAAAAKLTSGPTKNTYIYQIPAGMTEKGLFELSFKARGDGANSGLYSVYDNTHAALIVAETPTGIPGAVYGTVTGKFVVPVGCLSLRIILRSSRSTSGASAYFDDSSIKEMLTPAITGARITSTPGGSIFNWASVDAAFNFNDALGYTYEIVPAACTFNANFIVEKNKRATGPKPINLLTFDFATPVYLSDRDTLPTGGPQHLGLIKQWGFIDSSIMQTPGSGILGSIEIADLQLTIINSTSPRFSDNFTAADPPENVTVTLYQWFNPLAYADKEIIFKGVIFGRPRYNERTCTLTVRGIFQKYNRRIGEDKIIYAEAFPDADPDEYGRMGNIVYGNVKNIPCRAIVSGDVNSLVGDITAVQNSIELSDASYFPAAGVIGIDAEQISYTGNTGTTLTGCTRGYNSTTASPHLKGAPVWEELSAFVYQVASHPVKSIGDIFVDGVKITSICTKYTGQTGSELAGYEGMAVFTVPSRLTRQMAIDLLIDDGMTINDAIAVVDTIDVTDGITISDTIAVSEGNHSHPTQDATSIGYYFDQYEVQGGTWTNPGNLVDSNYSTYAELQSNGYDYNINVWRSTPYSSTDRLPTKIRAGIRIKSVPQGGNTWFFFCGSAAYAPEYTVDGTTIYGDWVDVGTTYDTWEKIAAQIGIVQQDASTSKTYEVFAEIDTSVAIGYHAATGVAKSGTVDRSGAVTKSGAAAKSGTVTREGAITLSGNSIADVRVGQLITAHAEGYQDDALGTYTGTPDALIEQPDHVFKHIWAVLCGAPAGDIDAASFAASGVFYAANTYKFALLIYEPVQAADLLMRLALQCRSRFIVTAAGKAKLLVRQLDQASAHSIIKNEIKNDSMVVEHSPTEEIINLFYINCDLDNTKSKSDPISYQYNIKRTDATSIARYGLREWQGGLDIFCFEAVTDPVMAAHVGDFLLAYHCRARKMPGLGVFLDNMEVESGDIIDVTHPLDNMAGFVCEVLKTIHHIGNRNEIDWREIIAVDNTT